jgi:hypothetical protein
LGRNFGVSEAAWEAILAPRDHPGGPWEQQDGYEVANNKILVDLGVIFGLVYFGFSRFVSMSFFRDARLEFAMFATSKSSFSH